MEEKRQLDQTRNYRRDDVVYFSIRGMNPQQIAYASQSSSGVCIIVSPERTIKGDVAFSHNYHDNKNEVLYISTTPLWAGILDRYLGHDGRFHCRIEFKVKHSYFRNLMESVHKIDPEIIRRIIPSTTDFTYGLRFRRIPRSPFRVQQLDRFQIRALRSMLFSKSTAPVLVPGPFGTGKTRLLSVASEYFITNAKHEGKYGRILLCCHQQDSADIFMRDYFIKMFNDRTHPWNAEVIRVVSQTHHRPGSSGEFVMSFQEFQSNFSSDICFKRHIVIVTTFLTALRMVDIIPQGFFTHILIDEGAQAREPECIAPLCMADKNTRIIIAGDSKQVSISFHCDCHYSYSIVIGWSKITCFG